MQSNTSNKIVSQMPLIDQWHSLKTLVEESFNNLHKDWEIPLWVYKALTNESQDIEFISYSLAFIQSSIILIDDILDNDPKGAFHNLGYGETSNLALALHVLGFQIIEDSDIDLIIKFEIIKELNRLQLETALGQHLDNQNILTEEAYWDIVTKKSRPFYEVAFKLGAILANVTLEDKSACNKLGSLFGEMIQLNDDINDAFELIANPDWERKGNNLLIIYASTADHPERTVFLNLLDSIYTNRESLRKAQDILIQSGGLSYAAYQLIQRYNQAVEIIESMNSVDLSLLVKMFYEQVTSIDILFDDLNLELSLDSLLV